MIRRLTLAVIAAHLLPAAALAQAPANTFLMTPPPSGIVPQASTALESGRVLKASPGAFYAVTVDVGTTAGKLVVLDAPALPASGATLTPTRCINAPASSTVSTNAADIPDRMQTGIVVLFTTGGCFTYTPSATVTFSGGRVQ